MARLIITDAAFGLNLLDHLLVHPSGLDVGIVAIGEDDVESLLDEYAGVYDQAEASGWELSDYETLVAIDAPVISERFDHIFGGWAYTKVSDFKIREGDEVIFVGLKTPTELKYTVVSL